jgi:uncharacterized protein (TIGR00661 family)
LGSKKRILVCPLDWGLGHATRCIPAIRELTRQGAEVIIAGDKGPLSLLRGEFPDLESAVLSGYDIRYPSGGNMLLSMALQAPGILGKIRAEHLMLSSIIADREIDAVISDNRYGLWTDKVPCVFITHQVRIKCPAWLRALEPFTSRLTRSYMERYTSCWIPDVEEPPGLSGDLSHNVALPANTSYIGPLSRFTGMEPDTGPEKFELVVVLSGPEPQRSILERILLEQLRETSLKTLLLRGRPAEEGRQIRDNVTILPHLSSQSMMWVLLHAELIICRPGYSTIMDLAVLGKNAVFIPTPGQTEQEYLAEAYRRNGSFFSMAQKDFNLKKALGESKHYKGFGMNTKSQLESSVRRLLDIL